MNITVFGATGQVGRRIVNMALAKGHHVRAFGRNIENLIDEDLRNENFEAVKGYVFDEEDVYNAVRESDAVFSALGGAMDGSDKTRSLGIKNIIAQMQKAGVQRLLAVGGMGVLKDTEHEYILQRKDYPPVFMYVSQEHLQAYLYMKESKLNWTFVCPPDIKNEDATGQYITSADYPPVPNKYRIAAGDIADFLLYEAVNNQYNCKRVGISN